MDTKIFVAWNAYNNLDQGHPTERAAMKVLEEAFTAALKQDYLTPEVIEVAGYAIMDLYSVDPIRKMAEEVLLKYLSAA